MNWLGDGTVDRLQAQMREPDLTGTRYRAIRFIAAGGMAEIWLAEDTVLQRNVALKVLDADDSSGLASRLLREAHILAALEHPGFVPVHDAGTMADGRVYYCMKYVQGLRLDDFVTRVPALPDRLRLLLRIAEPVAFAHSRGIIHRDLKPENVMVGPFGEVLVMDWGLGKVFNEPGLPSISSRASESYRETTDGANELTTNHGSILGTPGYMAPEQFQGDVARMDQRTDVYGLGAILSFLVNRSSQDGSRVPRPVNAICAKAMHLDPNQRYSSVDAFTADVAKYLGGSPVSAYRETLVERLARLFNRHRTAVILIVVYLLMRLLFILFSQR
jgi:eukaryotic-like serine/threonine-protein kinase